MRILVSALLLLMVLTGCGLTDPQRDWCRYHDVTRPVHAVVEGHPYHPYPNTDPDEVLRAAEKLGIAIPQKVADANRAIALMDAGQEEDGRSLLPAGWLDELDAWRRTSDYARACVEAFYNWGNL